MVTTVDRSGTNWLPYKSLHKIPPRMLVVGGVCTIMAAAGVMHKVRQRVGGAMPATMSKEWTDATNEKMRSGFEREAADPVPINPITHHKTR